jgi:predicted nucleotidyltransferase
LNLSKFIDIICDVEKAVLNELKQYFSDEPKILLAFLFGSYAKAREIAESDVDIAIWPREDFSKNEYDKLWSDLEKLLHKNVDLLLLNKTRPTTAWAAIRGKALLIRDYKLYLRFLLDVSREAEDMQDFIIDLFKWKRKLGKAEA